MTAKEASKIIDTPYTTVYRWLDQHAQYIPSRRVGRRIKLESGAVEVLRRIRALYAEGKSVEEVGEALAEAQLPVVVEVPNHPSPVPVSDSLATMAKTMELLVSLVEAQSKELVQLRETVEEQRDELEGLREEVATLSQRLITKEEPAALPEPATEALKVDTLKAQGWGSKLKRLLFTRIA